MGSSLCLGVFSLVFSFNDFVAGGFGGMGAGVAAEGDAVADGVAAKAVLTWMPPVTSPQA